MKNTQPRGPTFFPYVSAKGGFASKLEAMKNFKVKLGRYAQ
jgi:hypothetical protein